MIGAADGSGTLALIARTPAGKRLEAAERHTENGVGAQTAALFRVLTRLDHGLSLIRGALLIGSVHTDIAERSLVHGLGGVEHTLR